MKLYAVTVWYKAPGVSPKKLSAAYDLSSFGFFQRSSIREFMDFTGKIIVERTEEGQRTSVGEQNYMCHVYVRPDGLATLLISDLEYPQRVAFNILNKVLDEYDLQYTPSQWQQAKEELRFLLLEEYLQKFQNPASGDALSKLQSDVEETKMIMHKTMQSVLDRDEKLDDLVGKSEELSLQSKAFYKTAKKANKCCSLA